MKKTMIGVITGAMLFTMVSGTAVMAADITVDDAVDAATGQIIAHEQEPWEADDDMEFKGLLNPGEAKAAPAATGELTEAEAAAIAVKDAGFAESDVTVTKCVRDMDDGIEKYDISFRTADGVEYDYDIDVVNGTILEKDMDYGDD